MWKTLLAIVVLAATTRVLCSADDDIPPPENHPLDPVITWGEELRAQAATIKDYSALFIKRERINGKLQDYQYCQLKVRYEPFSVYLKFLAPNNLKGRECIYVDGKNDGKMLAHERGAVGEVLGTVRLWPDSRIAMKGQKYPITTIGIHKLGEELLADARRNRKLAVKCTVRKIKHAKVDGRLATCIEVRYPERQAGLQYHVARIFVDDEMKIPIRYEGYDWPEKDGGKPVLIEEYSYRNVTLNPGFTETDFDPKNPSYQFE